MPMNKLRTRAASVLLALSVLAGAGAAMAQAADPPAVAIAPVSDAEATKFVAANKKVTAVANSMTVELQGAASEEDAAAIQAKAEKQIVAAIQKEGITPTRYTEIIRLAETDAATLAKLRAKFGG
ncbi:DUF4168 domain-containing protein [Hyphomonas sp.]|uniref:DUF4168 domain-containing protein n=1 Tax=Hyphomonas sp. TaxID=87 RepID=UPI001BCC5635|nr:DUF4168 domain-containing protein [Hyphomonas sp.]